MLDKLVQWIKECNKWKLYYFTFLNRHYVLAKRGTAFIGYDPRTSKVWLAPDNILTYCGWGTKEEAYEVMTGFLKAKGDKWVDHTNN